MTLDSALFKAFVATVPHAVRIFAGDDAFDVALRAGADADAMDGESAPPPPTGAPSAKGVFYVIDAMASIEPSAAACGCRTRAEIAALEKELGRPLSDAETAHPDGAWAWTTYARHCARYVRRYIGANGVSGVAISFDVSTHPAKHLEHVRRYGSDADKRRANLPLSAADKTDKKEPRRVASDAEVEEALARATLPPNWKDMRGNPVFTRAVSRIIANEMASTPLPPGKCLIVAGDPRQPAEQRHVPVMYKHGAVPQLLRFVDFDLPYFEADFSVVHLATRLAHEGYDVVVRAVDGDTLFALVLEAPRSSTLALDAAANEPAAATASTMVAALASAPASTLLSWRTRTYMLREIGGKTMLIDIHAMHRGLAAPGGIDALAGSTRHGRHNVDFAIGVMMLLGNDYAYKFMPGIGPVTVFEALAKNADELAALFAPSASHAELALDKRRPHHVRVDRVLLHRLVAHAYAARPAASSKRPPSDAVDVALAALEYTLAYFANAANPHVAHVDPYELGASNLPLHGFELIDRAKPLSRDNVRVPRRVHISTL